MEYFFLGDEELVTAFCFVGIQGTAVRNENEAVSVFRTITEGGDYESDASHTDGLPKDVSSCRVLIITEETAQWLGDYLVNWQISGNYPLIVEIPGITGKHIGRKTMVEQIREAIGIHV